MSSVRTQARRWVYLVHRWLSIGTCVLALLWLISGVTMLFVGYPKLLPGERLQSLQPLQTLAGKDCCMPTETLLQRSPQTSAGVRQLMLIREGDRFLYRVQDTKGAWALFDARTGQRQPPADAAAALAGARRFVPGAAGAVVGRVQEDRWTHAGSLDAHRPLWQVEMQDTARTRLYISSATGEVVLDLPRTQRLLNYMGAWLHWLYMFREGSRDPVWSWTVIVLSALGTVAVVTGAIAGIWRWRFQGRYKSGSRSPYREGFMRWHHVLGLVFGAVLATWMFSGLMSMNPLGVFSARGQSPDLLGYRGGSPGMQQPAIPAHEVLDALASTPLRPVELEWRVLGGTAFVLARDRLGETRLLRRDDHGRLAVAREWTDDELMAVAPRLFGSAHLVSAAYLGAFDAYYFARGDSSMYAGEDRALPVLRLVFDDPGRTRVYVAPATGEVVLSADRAERAGRWLFNLLHSWDLPAMLRPAPVRDGVLILLSLGALGIAGTGTVLGLRRLTQNRTAKPRPKRANASPASPARRSPTAADPARR